MYPIPDGTNVNIIVGGSDIWLYCEVKYTSDTTPTVNWTRLSRGVTYSLLHNPPHNILRNFDSHGTLTSLMITTNFQPADSGSYHCTAMDGDTSELTSVVLVGTTDIAK